MQPRITIITRYATIIVQWPDVAKNVEAKKAPDFTRALRFVVRRAKDQASLKPITSDDRTD
jgi:hypothetical protein